MVLINQSSKIVECEIDGAETLILQPYEKCVVEQTATSLLVLKVSHSYGSSYGSCFGWDNIFQIVVDTTFEFESINSDSAITITREKVHFTFGYAYDRFFAKCNGRNGIVSRYAINGGEDLLQAVSQGNNRDSNLNRIATFVLVGNLGSTTSLFLLYKLIFWANDWKLSWWWIIAFWLGGFGLQVLGEKIYYYFKSFRPSKKQQELQRYITPEHVKEYYMNPKRKWIANDIETS